MKTWLTQRPENPKKSVGMLSIPRFLFSCVSLLHPLASPESPGARMPIGNDGALPSSINCAICARFQKQGRNNHPPIASLAPPGHAAKYEG